VTFKQGQTHSKANNALYFETSSKEGTGVKEMFQIIANQLLHISKHEGFDQMRERIKLTKKEKKDKKKKKKGGSGCC